MNISFYHRSGAMSFLLWGLTLHSADLSLILSNISRRYEISRKNISWFNRPEYKICILYFLFRNIERHCWVWHGRNSEHKISEQIQQSILSDALQIQPILKLIINIIIWLILYKPQFNENKSSSNSCVSRQKFSPPPVISRNTGCLIFVYAIDLVIASGLV